MSPETAKTGKPEKTIKTVTSVKPTKAVGRICGAALNLLLPPRCPLCDRILGKGERLICRGCVRELPLIRPPVCRKCGRGLLPEEKEPGSVIKDGNRTGIKTGPGGYAGFCPDCLRDNHLFLRGACTFRYEGGMRESVLRMKFHNRRDYLDFYASAMFFRHRAFFQAVKPRMLLAVPMHPKKKKERGYDQCRLLTRKISDLCRIPVSEDNLVRIRCTKPQKGLGRRERAINLQDSFRLNDPARIREPVLIIDDIYTTGATIDAVTAELNRHGIRIVYFLVLCG